LYAIKGEDFTILSDEELMLRYIDGEIRAFEVLFSRFPNLKNWIKRRTGSSEVADDIAQQAWVKIIKGKARYRPSAKFKTFLYHVAGQLIIDFYRKQSSQKLLVDDSKDASDPSIARNIDRSLESQIFDWECINYLDRCISELPDEQQQCLLLKFEGNFFFQEIAELLGEKIDTVKSRLRYARDKLKRCMPIECLQSLQIEGPES
jgi:RNA polymerase sigma-70 factor, ECF subfamily